MTTPSTWLVRCGENGTGASDCVLNDVVAVHYPSISDATELSADEVIEYLTDTPELSDRKRIASELTTFVHDMQPGDTVLTPDPAPERRRYIAGTVQGDYEWTAETPVPGSSHLRKVDWVNYLEWDTVPLEYRSIKYYHRMVLHIEDANLQQDIDAIMQNRLSKPELLATSATAPKVRKAAAPKAKKAPAVRTFKVIPPVSRLCSQCHLQKRFAQFAPGSDICVDCDG